MTEDTGYSFASREGKSDAVRYMSSQLLHHAADEISEFFAEGRKSGLSREQRDELAVILFKGRAMWLFGDDKPV